MSTGLCDGERLGAAAAAGQCDELAAMLAAGAEVDAVNELTVTLTLTLTFHPNPNPNPNPNPIPNPNPNP